MLLEAYQQALDAALARGAQEYGRVFDESPPGLGVHEIDAHRVYRRVAAGRSRSWGIGLRTCWGAPSRSSS